MKFWYNVIQPKAEGANPEIWIYDYIGDFGVTAMDFIRELKALDTPEIDVHINSGGGSIFDGYAMSQELVKHPAKINIFIDGLAASIASFIALAGDSIEISESGFFMIHRASLNGYFAMTAEEMRKQADRLDQIEKSIINQYTIRTGKDELEIIALMDDETWFDAQSAKEHGFVDTVFESLKAAASCQSVSNFTNVPEAYQARIENNQTPDAEEPNEPKDFSRLRLLRKRQETNQKLIELS